MIKYQIRTSIIAAVMSIVFLSSSISFANVDERTIAKTREAVEKASPRDWRTLALNAEKCFKKKVNLKQASEWLDQSLEIAETPFNLELKGDYCIQNHLSDKALEYYVRAMNAMKVNDGTADISNIQKKVSDIIHISG